MNTSSQAGPLPHESYDLVVLGGGAAGMTAALVGAIEGLKVLLIEKSPQLGGTSARSAGTLWIPGNFGMSRDEADADKKSARIYLNALIGNRGSPPHIDAFLEHGPMMLDYLRQKAGIGFKPCPRHADYHPDLPGARTGGRPVEAELFDGRLLGERFSLLRAPIPEFQVFGGMMVSKADIDLLLQARRSRAGAAHALKLGLRYLRDRVQYSRGTRLTMGNALCASLLHACLARAVTVETSTEVIAIALLADDTTGAHHLSIRTGASTRVIQATGGIIFAGGGFSGNLQARKQHLPKPVPAQTAAFEGADGSSQQLAIKLGARLGPSYEHNAWWFPSSIVPRRDGSTGVFPHIVMDRAKPGLIAVNEAGQRFVNEGISYHQFARAQYETGAVACWLICDARFIRRYGLGAIRPGGGGIARALADGYVHRADTLGLLAEKIGVDADGLIDSGARMTRYATTGVDEDFGKGSDPLSRQNGDPGVGLPNPGLGPIDTAPFYAVKVVPADLGTSRGLMTDEHGQLLDHDDEPLTGLYACGNDMQSIMAGQYPAPGVTLGPGMTFGFLAAQAIAAQSRSGGQSLRFQANVQAG